MEKTRSLPRPSRQIRRTGWATLLLVLGFLVPASGIMAGEESGNGWIEEGTSVPIYLPPTGPGVVR